MFYRAPFICTTYNVHKDNLDELFFNSTILPLNYIKVKDRFMLIDFLKKKPTIGKFKLDRWFKALELTWNLSIGSLSPIQHYIFFYYYLYSFPKGFKWDKQILFNINELFGGYSYKGWRHFFDLPANGQRTWSNGKTKYRLKNKLYNYQINCFKKKYGINTRTNLKMSFMAEHINLMWRLEWFGEWLSAYSLFKSTKQKTKFFRLKINYRHLLNLQITTPKSVEHKKKKKNRKKIKTEFTVGFNTLYVVSLFSKKKHLFKHL